MTNSRISVLLFILLLVLPLPFLPEYGGANSSTRLMLVDAIVRDGSTQVDRYAELTGDKAEHDGHFYSDKAPGMSLLAVPIYAVGRAFSGGDTEDLFRFSDPITDLPFRSVLLYRVIVWLTGGAMMALAGVALFRMCLRLGASAQSALLASLSVCVATPFLGWSVQFFGHVGAGSSLALAFALSTGIGREDTWLSAPVRAVVAGAALSIAVTIEYTAAPPAIMVALYALWRLHFLPARTALTLLAVALGASLVTALPLLIYHTVSFGGPFKIGYSSVIGFEGMQQGFLGLTLPDPTVLWRIIFGFKRGILWLSPLMVLVPWGIWIGLRQPHDSKDGIKAEMILCLSVILYYFLLNASYFYWDGGSSVGPRHTIPSMPFMALPFLCLWTMLQGRLRIAALSLFGLSVFFSIASASMSMTTNTSWRFPIKDPILENLLTHQNVFFKYAEWGISPLFVFGIWLVLCLGLFSALWRRATNTHR